MSNSVKTLRKSSELTQFGLTDDTKIAAVTKRYAMAITPTMAAQITTDLDSPIAMQFVPDEKELDHHQNELPDPIGDEAHSPIRGIVHRYADRCLLKPVHVCPVYCRFCFRRETVGPGSDTLTPTELEQALDYIRQSPGIWEVILSGGDPLILKPAQLKKIMQALGDIDHVGIVRLHSRVPLVSPARITDDMLSALKLKNKATYISIHCNHSDEFTAEGRLAIARLADAGFPLLSQTVLLKGVNNSIDSLSDLMKTCLKNRIKPYYLHHADKAQGTAHFRTTIQEGQALVAELQARFSGLCQPRYVLDIPGGFGKVSLMPSSVECVCDNQYKVTDRFKSCHDYVD